MNVDAPGEPYLGRADEANRHDGGRAAPLQAVSVEAMIEMAPQIHTQEGPEELRTEVAVHELQPLEQLPVGIFEHTLYVSDGVVYVILEQDELALTAGDQIGIRRGELRRAWNAGDETARVVVATRSTHH
jgi:hypothetical protein